ncbi:MAG: ferrochelatase [Zetaproteobacteria bacterium CG12_big_fil_rev_8_21_14_0_65_54_13]|nr:MAG: ferrochelatase [Zetaproteobacteria bacterium CG23_combo_of_CG06-09_8_20_14_all_54_7]PIW44896.1 MAG: ferrochelatase [Zetaproteobacteria bacterium CG12_big_fil_rev_8_21_14_0_65_54_13]PIX55942.1 MAG: ferrochelatase [Zetaproteobacteria bacterium CG_4_10_14_3_um_filter_54_28]PJA30702.1 MAG: ferrochelatase [Zetaproteobacteria bacterium CG_4_9_14_3_um_filter_54_145]
MTYSAQTDFHHDQQPAIGILLTNLGTPDAPTKTAVRAYLKEFLSDPRVVEQPRWLWWLILNGVILNIRPAKSAASYRSVWSEEGSPLLAIGNRQRDKLERALQRLSGSEAGDSPIHIELAMRYGNPSIPAGLEALRAKNCRKLIVLPLYPQYSATTSGSTFDAIADVFRSWRRIPAVSFIDAYHDDPAYIDALAASVRAYWQQHGKPERLLMSFHGIPERYFKAGDPYPCHCRKTARLLRESLGLSEEEAQISFQSRFGREPWMQPYTDATLKQWASDGVASVDVVCPGFSADCLETLEEVAIENRDYFLNAGGSQYRYIPALNDSDAHIDALAQLLMTEITKR